jgi:hypothetical protein
MIVSALATPSYESHLHSSKNVTEKAFFGETSRASSVARQIEEVGIV